MNKSTTEKLDQERISDLNSPEILEILDLNDYKFLSGMAAKLCDTSFSVLSIRAKDKLFVLASYGLDTLDEASVSGFCIDSVNNTEKIMIIEDTRNHELLSVEPIIIGGKRILFYAGVQLVDKHSNTIGSFCVLHTEPKSLKDCQVCSLNQLARQTTNLLELHSTNIQEKKLRKQLDKTLHIIKHAQQISGIGAWELELSSSRVFWTDGVRRIFQVSEDFLPTLENSLEFFHKDDLEKVKNAISLTIDENISFDINGRILLASSKIKWIRITGKKILGPDKIEYLIGTFADISKQKEKEHELSNYSQKLESIFNEMQDVIWSVEIPSYKVLFITPSAEELFEIKIEQWLEDNTWWEKCIYEEDKHYRDIVYKSLEESGEYNEKYRIKTPSGAIKWIRNRGKFIYNEQGVPIRLDGILTDISKKVNIQETLDQELRLQEVLTDIASTYINLEPNKVEATINESLKRMGLFVAADRAYIFDYDFEKQTTSNTYEWCNEGINPEIENLQDVPNEFFPQWIEKHQKGEAFLIESVSDLDEEIYAGLKAILEPQGIKSLITIPMIDGKELLGFVGFDSVENYHIYSKKEQRILFLFGQMLINIRNRQKWETQLKIQEEKYRNILANMNLGLVEFDLSDRIIFANQRFCAMANTSCQQLRGRHIGEIFSNDSSKNEIFKRLLNQSSESFDESTELEIIDNEGRPQWWFMTCASNYNDSGKLTGRIGIFLDITEKKSLEIELAKAKTTAETAAKAKELFLANMSHEIRTPLNVIIGMIRQLSREKLSEKQLFYVNQSESSAKHLLTILNNILDIAKIESGELELNEKEFNMDSLINSIHSILSIQAQEKNLDFFFNVNKEIHPNLIGDDVRIRQVLFNLIGNSLKFTDHGKIEISVNLVENLDKKQTLLFEVTDTGVGMSEKFLKRVFNKFTQEEDGSDRKYEGTGLGMAISFDLVRLMGGEIWIDSKKGSGSKISFKLTLPTGKIENLISKTGKNDKSNFSGFNLLLVEDNEMNRFIAAQSISILGCKLDEAINGRMAVEMMMKKKYDLVLMDIQMPVMSGVEATKYIRQVLSLDTPIIALTANAFKHDIEMYLAIGMNDYITKPYNEEDFLRIIKQQLNLPIQELENEEENEEVTNLYHLEYLQKLSRGNEAFITQMLQIFCNLISENVGILETALNEKDIITIQKTAHRIKPSISQMGIDSLKEKILSLETFSLEKHSTDELTALVEHVVTKLRLIVQSIKEKELSKP